MDMGAKGKAHWSNRQYWFDLFQETAASLEPNDKARLAVRMLELLAEQQKKNERKALDNKAKFISKKAMAALADLERGASKKSLLSESLPLAATPVAGAAELPELAPVDTPLPSPTPDSIEPPK
jgi:hypothetical protein